MEKVHIYTVRATLPQKLEKLRELAYNLYWCWNHEVIELFRRIDRDLWEEVVNNPIMLLGKVPQHSLERLAEDSGFQANLNRVYSRYKDYMQGQTWYDKHYKDKMPQGFRVGYFSAEFGISESLPIYSGGLGMLAGDHLKSASDLGIPLIGIGLLYQQGYFRQYLNIDGWQQEEYPDNDFFNMPVEEVLQDGKEVLIGVEYPGRTVYGKVWKALAGRIALYLLDTNITNNSPEDRMITYQLYGGDVEMRLKQEIMLGIGGMRMVNRLNLMPVVCHINEGHAAFLCLERVRMLIQEHRLEPQAAIEAAASGNMFTTHTPVPAGFDLFSPELMNRYFGGFASNLKIPVNDLINLGRGDIYKADEPFNMAVLALKNSGFTNGVSRLHGQVSRQIFNTIIPSIPVNETPISSVTNGIHTPTWMSREMMEFLIRYLGEEFRSDPSSPALWQQVQDIPADELWMVHQKRKERLISTARKLLQKQLLRRGAPQKAVDAAASALSHTCLTIGFARRFATYKRATLLLKDRDRLKAIINNPEQPVQFIFAGKAHPKDEEGKKFIREIVHFCRQDDVRKRFVFIENYDMKIARYLVSGVDVWLNNPLRPLEASGTSGMKVTANGGLNLSILDGWWDEAYQTDAGWAIGQAEHYDDNEYQNRVESQAIYHLLENEIAPLFYERNAEALPVKWIEMMKNSMIKLAPVFNTHRMVREYFQHFYVPTSERYVKMSGNQFERAKRLSQWRQNIYHHWKEVRIIGAEADSQTYLTVGAKLKVTARVHLGKLDPKFIRVDAYNGPLDRSDNITHGYGTLLAWKEAAGNGVHIYEGDVFCRESGRHGFTIRVLPTHEDLPKPVGFFEILWE